jgi:hypothetical protein
MTYKYYELQDNQYILTRESETLLDIQENEIRVEKGDGGNSSVIYEDGNFFIELSGEEIVSTSNQNIAPEVSSEIEEVITEEGWSFGSWIRGIFDKI